jgi:hypothetical protein
MSLLVALTLKAKLGLALKQVEHRVACLAQITLKLANSLLVSFHLWREASKVVAD